MKKSDLITEFCNGVILFEKKIFTTLLLGESIKSNFYFEKIKENSRIIFEECIFENNLIFEGVDKKDLTVIFRNCSFKSFVKFERCIFKEISFQYI